MTPLRFINRFLFHLTRSAICLLVYVNHRLYMRLYNAFLKKSGLQINGEARFIAKSVKFDNVDLITLGDRAVISMNVHFLTHDYSYTTALIAINEKPDTDIATSRGIRVGNNVFIGMNSIIMPGTLIGNNVIIGAGSVVRGTIPDYSLLVGNPAQIVGDTREYAKKQKNRKDNNLIVDKK